jgi:hypothetical protein
MLLESGWKRRLALSGAVLACAALGWAQYAASNGQVGQNAGSRQQGGFGQQSIETDPIFVEKRMRALNADRHKAIISDADKMVKLARQLDAEIASNPTSELTPAEVQKIATIEKLARNVKTKMAESFSGSPTFHSPLIPPAGPGLQ